MKTILIAAMTLCGKISPAGLAGPEDRRFLEEMRATSQAGIVGAGTLRAEDLEMRGPGGRLPEGRIRALVSASGEFPVEGRKIFQLGPPPLIFTGEEGAKRVPALVKKLAELVIIPDENGILTLAFAWEHLAGRGVEQLLIEGGAHLNYQALAQRLVDEVLVTITPQLSGDRAATSLVEGPLPLGWPFLPLQLLACRPGDGGELFCRYRLARASRT